ncbi:hypothetical protein [Thermomonas sp.]|uniref:hypothetical protein n=1 Tax=Thermomonas sp. TaxID=1971895 RepID=UPI00260745F9|nr:hypothetical protein [Thermomonas sp.]
MKLVTLLVAAVLSTSTAAEDQRIPPTNPALQYIGNEMSGEAVFLEATTFGRYQDHGFAWMLVMYPDELKPTWIREIMDCMTGVITDDYIVWLDPTTLQAFGQSDQGFPMQARTRRPAGPNSIDQKMVRAACSGKPLNMGEPLYGVQAAVDWVASHLRR